MVHSGSSVRTASSLLVLIMMVISCSPPVRSFSVDDIEGAASMELIFDDQGHHTVGISIPRPFHLMSATMNVSGGPLSTGSSLYPTNVSVDIGDDDVVEWAFDGQGYGPLGQQQVFSDGASIKEIHVQGPTDRTLKVLIPENGTIGQAEVTVTGVPSETVNGSLMLVNQTQGADSSLDHHLSGPTASVVIEPGSRVLLDDVVGVVQGIDVDIDPAGPHYSHPVGDDLFLAQSFVINASDPKQDHSRMYAIEFIPHLISQPPPADLRISIYNVTNDGNYDPTGDPIVSELVGGSSIPEDTYLNVTFDPAPLLETGRPYAVMFEFTGAVGMDRIELKANSSLSGTNTDSIYPVDGCWVHTSSDGTSWTSRLDRDLMFRTHVDVVRNLTTIERQDITIDGISPTDMDGDLIFDIPEPDIGPQGWNIAVDNALLVPILYNISANISYHDLLADLVVDIGNDSCPELKRIGQYTDVQNLDGLSSSITSAMADGQAGVDQYGNRMVEVPIAVQATGNGTIRFENLVITYDRHFPVPGMMEAIDELQGGQMDGYLVVPVNVTSGGPGTVELSGLAITFDGPPRPLPLPNGPVELPEEGHNSTLLDLGTLFEEDFDAELTFSMHNFTADGPVEDLISVQVSDGYLDVNASEAVNWSGRLMVHVNATDDIGYTAMSSQINISVVDVNDPPVITSVPPTVAIADVVYEYHFSVVDSDSDVRDCWLVGAPDGMVVDLINLTLVWTPGPQDEGDHEFVLKVSDGEFEVGQQVRLSVLIYGPGNKPPTVQKVLDRTVVKGQEMSLQIDAIDPEDDPITYFIVQGPQGLKVGNQTGLVQWTPSQTGNHTVTIRVSDGTRWTDMTFAITVLEEVDLGLTIEYPERGTKVPRAAVMKGRATATGSNLVKVEYRIDDGEWHDAQLDGTGLWKAEPDLSKVGKGSHTLLVRATDDTGNTAQNYTTFSVEKEDVISDPVSRLTSGRGLSLLFLLIAVIAVIGALAAWSMGRRGKKGRTKRPAADKGDKEGGGKAGQEEAVPPVAKEGPTKNRVDSAFLVYHDGRLITYSSTSEIDDLDSTLQVIKDFVKASFKGETGRLDALRYENRNIILERGIQMYLVAMTPKDDVKDLRRDMRRFLNDVHKSYRSALKVWDGNFKKVKGIGVMVERFVSGAWVPDQDVKEDDEGAKSQRWDDSPDLDDRSTSNIEKLKALEDKLLRGEMTEKEFERLSERYR